MNANAVARHYALLTPEERFQLILAAGARGDDAEQDRLIRAGGGSRTAPPTMHRLPVPSTSWLP